MSSRLRRVTQTFFVCVILVTNLLPAYSNSPSRIAVVLSRDVAPYREALAGFEEVLVQSGRAYRTYEFTLEGLAAERGTLARKILARKPDLILTIGSAATELVSQKIKDVPIVFSMVLPSSGNRSLEGLTSAHGNITGASMEIPVLTQFTKLREVLPDARKIGVIYDPTVSGPAIETAARAAEEMGLELVPITVSSETDVLESTQNLAQRVDVLWSVADSTVFSPQGLKHILLATLRSRVPFVGLSPSFVKAGALLALSTDYRDLGRQSGEQSLRVLTGVDPARLPMTVPRSLSLSINMNTAKQIQVQIQDAVRQKAEIFF